VELARLNRPGGALLILWPYSDFPTVWGLTMAAYHVKLPLSSFFSNLVAGGLWFFLFEGKSLIWASAGCIWNDIIDRDFDRRVERTKKRPVATGKITVYGALLFLSLHLVALSIVLTLGNNQIRSIGFMTLYPLAGVYPFIKRISYWPQAWLGIAFNTGTLMAWSVTSGSIPYSSISLGAATWFWTMWYDTIYGSQDKKDDLKIGIKSTALLFKSSSQTRLFLAFHATMFIVCMTLSGILNHQTVLYYCVTIPITAINLFKQYKDLDLNSPVSCWKTFCNSSYVLGPIVFLGLMTDYLYRIFFQLFSQM
ncbi:UbiA prenyltransferase family, partial [Gymnopilus junonius]